MPDQFSQTGMLQPHVVMNEQSGLQETVLVDIDDARPQRWGWGLLVIGFGGFMAWALFAPLDAGVGLVGLATTLVRGMVAPDASEQAVLAAERLMARVPEASYRAALSAIVSFSRLENLAHIRVPALCIAGEHDQNATPGVMEKMAARIPEGQYVCLDNVGHLANMERPDAFNAVVLEFLKQHFSG